MEQMWESGSIGALDGLASYYSGVFGDDAVAPDRLKAYAYTYLYSQFLIEEMKARPGQRSESLQQDIQEEIDRLAAKLSPFELKQARSLAKSILRENKNCCFLWR